MKKMGQRPFHVALYANSVAAALQITFLQVIFAKLCGLLLLISFSKCFHKTLLMFTNFFKKRKNLEKQQYTCVDI